MCIHPMDTSEEEPSLPPSSLDALLQNEAQDAALKDTYNHIRYIHGVGLPRKYVDAYSLSRVAAFLRHNADKCIGLPHLVHM